MVDPPLYKFAHLMPAEVMDHIPTDAAGAADLFFLLSSLLLMTFAGASRPSHLCLFPFLSLFNSPVLDPGLPYLSPFFS